MIDMRSQKLKTLLNPTMICVTKETRTDLNYLKINWKCKTYDETIVKLIAEAEVKTFY